MMRVDPLSQPPLQVAEPGVAHHSQRNAAAGQVSVHGSCLAAAQGADGPHCPRCCCEYCRGKLLNVRDASAAQISANTEIQNIKQILGLQHGKVSRNNECPATRRHQAHTLRPWASQYRRGHPPSPLPFHA